MKTLIVFGKADLNKLVNQAITAKRKAESLLHIAALATMHHAATHGDCSLMNRLAGALHDNELTAFRTYWKRLSWEITREAETGLVKYDSKVKEFSVLTVKQNANASKWLKEAAAFMVERMADCVGKWSPDATGDADTAKDIRPFYETNNVRDVLTGFDDKAAYKALKTLHDKATADKATGGGPVTVSRMAIVEIEKALTALDRLVNNDSATARAKEDRARYVASKERAKNKPRAAKPKATKPADKPAETGVHIT